jgi:hypothetical protein
MPLITLNQTSYQFPVQLPGDSQVSSGNEAIALGVNWLSEPNLTSVGPVSLEITGAATGIFEANLFQQPTQGVRGPIQPTLEASTTGVSKKLDKPIVGTTYPIVVAFTPPAAPVPGYFTGDLAVSGWGGTATMTLVATTAKITKVTAEVIGVDNTFVPKTTDLPDADIEFLGPFANVQIDIASGDPNPLKVVIAVKSQSIKQLQISPERQTISVPAPLIIVENRKDRPPFEVPGPFRVGVASFQATVDDTAVSGPGTVEFTVSTPDFPWLTSGLPPIEVAYKLQVP